VLVECFILNISDNTHDDIAGNVIGDDDDDDEYHLVSSTKAHKEDEDLQLRYDATLFINIPQTTALFHWISSYRVM
jgi:hypothetical protein